MLQKDWEAAGNTGVAPFSKEAPAVNANFKLTPTQFEKVRVDNKVSDANFDQFFTRQGTDIYLNPEAKITEVASSLNNTAYDVLKNRKPEDVGTEVGVDDLSSGTPTPNITPVAGSIENAYIEAAKGNVANAQDSMMAYFADQKAKLDTQIADLQKTQADADTKIKEGIEKMKPEDQDWFNEEKALTQTRLDAAKSAAATLQSNFDANQKSIDELNTVLTTAEAQAKAEDQRMTTSAIKNYTVSKIKSDASGRAGVVQAVIAARNGQINMAYTMINQATTAINAHRQDDLEYYNALANYYSGKETDAKADIKYKDSQKLKMVEEMKTATEDRIKESQEVKDYITKIMQTDPNAADQAGLSLNDTLATASKKMADWERKYGGVSDLRDTYIDAGISLTDTREQALQKVINNSSIYKKATRIAPVGGGGDGMTDTESYNANVSTTSKWLASQKGTDGFVSPETYQQGKSEWVNAGYTPGDYDKEFAGFRNPRNPNYITGEAKAFEETTIPQTTMSTIATTLVKKLGVEQAKEYIKRGSITSNKKVIDLSTDQIQAIQDEIDRQYPKGERTLLNKILPGGK